MQVGIFAKTFVRPSLESTLDAIFAQGIRSVQFNMSCAGLPSMPTRIAATLAKTIQREMYKRQIGMAAVSGTFNMIDPNPEKRRDGMTRLRILAAACAEM